MDKTGARKKLGLDPDATYIAVLPGSRQSEIKYLAELFISTAHRCWKIRPNIKFITSAINPKRDQEFQTMWRKSIPEVPINFLKRVHMK